MTSPYRLGLSSYSLWPLLSSGEMSLLEAIYRSAEEGREISLV